MQQFMQHVTVSCNSYIIYTGPKEPKILAYCLFADADDFEQQAIGPEIGVEDYDCKREGAHQDDQVLYRTYKL